MPRTSPPRTSPAQPQAVVQGTKLKMLPLVCTPRVVNESITAVSFNIKSRTTDVASILADSGADIVLLQEVDRNRASSRRVDQAGLVAGALGMTDAFGANVLRGGDSQYGTAVLSRYPIVSVHNTLLPNAPGGQQRGLLHVVVNVRGVKLSIYDTHLQNRMEALRVRQMGTVAAIMREDPNPIILGGDFNATPRSQPVQIALSVVDDPWAYGVGVGSQLTHPSSHPRGRIDYLLHRGPGPDPDPHRRADPHSVGPPRGPDELRPHGHQRRGLHPREEEGLGVRRPRRGRRVARSGG